MRRRGGPVARACACACAFCVPWLPTQAVSTCRGSARSRRSARKLPRVPACQPACIGGVGGEYCVLTTASGPIRGYFSAVDPPHLKTGCRRLKRTSPANSFRSSERPVLPDVGALLFRSLVARPLSRVHHDLCSLARAVA